MTSSAPSSFWKPVAAVEDLVIKISVQGSAQTFGWVVPFPSEPKVHKEDPKLFRELFDYVERRRFSARIKGRLAKGNKLGRAAAVEPHVLGRQEQLAAEALVVELGADGATAATRSTWRRQGTACASPSATTS